MQRFGYIDSNGVERVIRADTLPQAVAAVKRVERERSGSIAAGEVAARTVKADA